MNACPSQQVSKRTLALLLNLSILITVAPAAADPTPQADPGAFARVRAYENARIQVIERNRPAVACLYERDSRAGGGSGVIVDKDGYGLTNYHVVAGMLEERIGEAGLTDGQVYNIEVLGIDPGGDVAMFRVYGRDSIPFVELGDSEDLRVGDYVLAMGNAFLLSEDYTPTVSLGIVSGLHRYQEGAGPKRRILRYTECIQVDASINPGNSGGPLFDLSGKLVGINGRISFEERSRVNVGVGYAISINQIKRFMPMLRAGLPAKHATAGFNVFDRARDVVVNEIRDESPAYAAGLRQGDVILQFAGATIRSANHFGSILGTFPADWPVQVVYQRDDNTETIRFRLEDLPLPKLPEGSPDIYGQHKVTNAANRRAVRRAFDLYHRAVGGQRAVARLKALRANGTRLFERKPESAATPIELDETRAEASKWDAASTPPAIERAIRWRLFQSPTTAANRGYKVVAADDVGGHIAVVLQRDAKTGPTFRAAFDDVTGRLLAVEFDDPTTGKRVRYEYDDYRRQGGLKLPHERRLFLDDELYAVDRFSTISVKG